MRSIPDPIYIKLDNKNDSSKLINAKNVPIHRWNWDPFNHHDKKRDKIQNHKGVIISLGDKVPLNQDQFLEYSTLSAFLSLK